MTNEQLVARIQAGEDVSENMCQLYDQVKDFIRSIAWKYRNSAELDDLEQEGYLALYPAIDGFNPAAGYNFLTYAEKWIRQRMQRYIQMNRSCLRLPVHCLEKISQYRRFCTQYEQQTGESPSDSTAAYFMGISVEQVRNIRTSACMASVSSLDAPIMGADEEIGGTFGDFIPAAGNLEEDSLERLEAESLQAVLWGCVDELPGQQGEILRRRYQDGETLAGIGRQTGCTMEQVRQEHNKALRNLRRGENREKLLPFAPEDDRIYSMALMGNGVERFQSTWTSSTERIALEL